MVFSLFPTYIPTSAYSTGKLTAKPNLSLKFVPSTKLVTGVQPQTTTADFIENFEDSANVTVNSDTYVTTGSKVSYKGTYAADVVIYGDCSLDGNINAKDNLLLRKALANIITFTQLQTSACDVNNDKSMDAKDVLFLRKSLVNLCNIRNNSLYYVSKSGNDLNDGSENNPFLTIQKAASILNAGDTCVIKSGIYRETVSPANQGEAGATISFVSYNNDTVEVTGAQQIKTPWTLYGNGIYKTNITLNRGNQNQIFINNTMANLARYPNKTTDSVVSVGNTLAATAGSDSSLTSSHGFADNALVGAKIATEGTNHYIYYSSSITSNDTSKISYTKLGSSWDSPTKDSRFFVYDKLSLLDYDNEWFYDSASSTLYYKPKEGADINNLDIEYSLRPHTFNVAGKAFITIKGLTIFDGQIKNDKISTNLNIDSNKIFYTYHTNVTRHYPWENDYYGVELHGTNSVVQNCEIAYSAEAGVVAYANNCSIVNNYIHDINYINSNAMAAQSIRCNYTLISHNTMTSLGRSAVDLRSQYMRVSYNDISNCAVNTHDVSGIGSYNFDAAGTIEVDHNVVHSSNQGKGFTAYYLDNNSKNYTVHHNVSYNVDNAMVLNNPSTNNRVYNNTFVRSNQIATGNLQDPSKNNEFCGAVWPDNKFYNNIMPGTFYGYGANFSNNLHADDPAIKFGDATNNDFTLQSGSAAIGKAIQTDLDYAPTDIGAYTIGEPKWTAGHDFSKRYEIKFSLSRIDPNFVQVNDRPFEEMKTISGGNILDQSIFGAPVTLKDGWVNQIFNVTPGQRYYMSCNAQFTTTPDNAFIEYGVHFMLGDNIIKQSAFMYTQTTKGKLETIFTIPPGTNKLRYFAASWSKTLTAKCDSFQLIRVR